jgi:diguanylate cyclase (GGDEF)-like protein
LQGLASKPEVQRAIAQGDASALAQAVRRAGGPYVVVARTKGAALGSAPVPAIQVGAPARIQQGGGELTAYLPAAALATRVNAANHASGTTLYVVGGGRAYGPGGATGAASTVPGRAPERASIAGTQVQAASVGLPGGAAIVATYPQRVLDDAIQQIRVRTIIAVFGMSLVIAALAWWLVRSLTETMRVFASRARAVAEGRFDERLPARGNDEFAQFGRAFNEMSEQLERRISELETERRRVEEATERFGSALASSHDVTALLEIVLGSAMQAARAGGGRLLMADEGSSLLVEQLRMGRTDAAGPVLDAPLRLGEGVEGRALQSLYPTAADEPVPALCAPLLTERTVLGLLTLVEPAGGRFDADAPRAVGALAAQGAIAIENARLHRLIQKQARTDGLTGLLNHREFQEQLGREVERAQRFGVSVGLIFLDLDDFKLINDRHGHLAGDAVLKAVAQVVRGCIRDIDHAARYGGEEFAVILPHTSLEGAIRLAERIRQAVAESPVPLPEGGEVHVTTSLGVAAVPVDATTQIEAIAAADAALYRAKQSGKNRLAAGGPAEGAA